MKILKNALRTILPQWLINNFYHLPRAILANIFYDFPTRRLKVRGLKVRGLKVIGVTGTDGKTTTVNMIYQILKGAGKKVSMVSSIDAVIGGKTYATGFHVTSPDPFSVQRFAKKAVAFGDEYLILEVTSHALDQYRSWGVNFDIGIITNITHEHLDYHKSWENYFQTKVKLIKNVKFAIINQNLKQNVLRPKTLTPKGKLITFGLNSGDFNQRDLGLKLKIPGDYNIENALSALACSFALRIDRKLAQKTLEQFKGIVGRMEEIKNKKGIKIMIDFAHTPNALEKALKTLRSKVRVGRLIAVFGSAGKRDIDKRTLMGEVAGRLADMVVVTAEDPRGELEKICEQVAFGARKAGAKLDKNLFIIGDRGQAIDFAINNLAKRGDVIGIFGKGHERSMNYDGKTEIPWSDREAVEKVLASSSQHKKPLARPSRSLDVRVAPGN